MVDRLIHKKMMERQIDRRIDRWHSNVKRINFVRVCSWPEPTIYYLARCVANNQRTYFGWFLVVIIFRVIMSLWLLLFESFVWTFVGVLLCLYTHLSHSFLICFVVSKQWYSTVGEHSLFLFCNGTDFNATTVILMGKRQWTCHHRVKMSSHYLIIDYSRLFPWSWVG